MQGGPSLGPANGITRQGSHQEFRLHGFLALARLDPPEEHFQGYGVTSRVVGRKVVAHQP